MQEGYRSAAVSGLNQWALFSRGLTSEQFGPSGERYAHVSTEVEQRAIYHAWARLMKGESHVIATNPVVPTLRALDRGASSGMRSGA